MMFVDEVVLEVIAGAGGNGCLAFHHAKFKEMAGPWGGDGGQGSDIVFKTSEGLNTLIDFRHLKVIKGHKGLNGSGKLQQGARAKDLVFEVPIGTIISDCDTGLIMADLNKKGDSFIVAHGGAGGRGNATFATHANTAPNYAENGAPGERRQIKVELKLLADVGLVGLPSVGKSTIISKISAAKPKIAAYPFTTLHPNLGVVELNDHRSFVVADLPGLIKGASLGAGLGDQFLKHIQRTRVIAHVLDMSEDHNPYDDYVTINKELEQFDPNLMLKPQIIIANKMDQVGALAKFEALKAQVKVPLYPVSALTNEGLKPVVYALADMLDQIKKTPLYEEAKFESHVLYKYEAKAPFTITKEGDTFIVRGDAIEKLLRMTRFTTDEAAIRFANKLKRFGVDEELKKQGAKSGDYVRILDYEFEYKE